MNFENEFIPPYPELDKELQDAIYEGENFNMIRHPLVNTVYSGKPTNRMMNRILAEKKKQLEIAIAEGNFAKYVFMHERPYRLGAFDNWVNDIQFPDGKEYWEVLRDIWTDSENIWQNKLIWRKRLTALYPDREFFMTEDERQLLAAMPDRLTIYRGCKDNNKSGYSWTLDIDVAKWFSKRFKGKANVLTKTVLKEDVFAYVTSRNEQEIIYLK